MAAAAAGSVTEEQAAGVGILLQISMLVLAFVLGHLRRRRRLYYIPEASASSLLIGTAASPICLSHFRCSCLVHARKGGKGFLVLEDWNRWIGLLELRYGGLIVGGLANISNTQKSIRRWFNFWEEFFFFFLLPPIIFLAPKPFFSNFGAIVTFAIMGTFMASIITGLLVYLTGLIHLVYKLPLVECMMFGALVSATDPVTVLSIFQELGTDVNLFALVFGESVLNVATLLTPFIFRTMSSFRDNASAQSIFVVILRFLVTFFGSTSTGLGVGFISAILLKYAGLDVENLHNLESCLFVLLPYFSYMLPEGFGLSGIVSILFTGIVMKRYTFSNLSEDSQRFTAAFFHLLSSLAETFVAATVFSCAYLRNFVRPPHPKISKQQQLALWYSGLRGAMAFALALQSVHDLPEGHGQTILLLPYL